MALDLPVGTVVLYEQDSEPILALVHGSKKDKLSLINEKGRAVDLAPTRLSPFKISFKDSPSAQEQSKFLLALKAQSLKLAESVNLEELWQIATEFPKSYSSEELAELAFANPSAEQHLSVKLLLLSDKAYFKRDNQLFLARAAHIVEEIKHSQHVQLERKRLRRSLVESLKGGERAASTLPEELSPLIALLKRYAVGSDLNSSEEREARELTELLLEGIKKDSSKVNPAVAYQLLERLGIFGALTNPAWERAGLPGTIVFKEGSERKSESLACTSERQDLTALDVFTIDDITTRDMDDALSLESKEFGYRLGIHITDVSAEIDPNSQLDKAVSQRLSSIYLPERTIHMLPEALSLERLSLRESQARKAMTLFVDLDRSYQILKTQIVASTVVVKRRWTYDQVDDLLENSNSEFSTFYEIACALEEARILKGAARIQKTEIAIGIDQAGRVSLSEIDEQSPARSLIAEMAVLINRVIAEYCRDNKIPVIYRGQPEAVADSPDKPEEGRALDHFIRVHLKRSEASLVAKPHSGLGLDAYLQITSPIRRFVDLINQRQLMAFISNRPLPYSFADLEKILESLEDGLQKISKVSKESKRFWLLRYLEQRVASQGDPNSRRIGGVVVRLTPKNPLIELDEVFFAAFAKANRKLEVGEKVQLVISAIVAKDDYLRLEVV
jgi:exoribonuclease-2